MMRALFAPLLAALCLVAALTGPANAQSAGSEDDAVLLADRVEIAGNDQLIATGNVEVLQGTTRMTASRILYDQSTNMLVIDGPITLTDGADTVILASEAALSTDLRNGLLRSARMVLNQQLQLAAAEINRVNGRYTQLYKTVASTCQVCGKRPVPLWQIRAKRIIHDEEARQLYFDGARFEVAGVPIMYLPRLRLPDPTLKRTTGFLAPTFRSTDKLGFGVKIPYFITLGDHADLTLTPYLSTNSTRTLEMRFRRAFRAGTLTFNGAVSEDDIREGELRSYGFVEGQFDIGRGYELTFDVETVSDTGYLLDYGYSDKDRLDSTVAIARTRRDQNFQFNITAYRSLRDGESNETQPTITADLHYEKRFTPRWIGGSAGFTFDLHNHYRRSELDVDSVDDDLIVDGRDVTRASARLDWRRDWLLSNGILIGALGAVNFDWTSVTDDAAYSESVFEVTPQAAVELRWPFIRRSPYATHILEPIVQVAWTPESDTALPNDESTLLELDEGNLFSLDRFPGGDVYERGLRTNIGLRWTRFDANGWTLGVTLGRIIRSEDLGQFAGYPGLEGRKSDWLAAVQLELPNRLTLTNRALFDDNFSFAKNELRAAWRSDRLAVAGSYIWMEANPLEERPLDVNELTLDTAWQVDDNWLLSLDWRYDVEQDRAAEATFGVEWRNECVEVDFTVSRRFTSSTAVDPTTDIGLQVSLTGFGAGRASQRHLARACRG
ncbi:LPS-assembly protein LptD [Vannielia litorea]|uniref:LPS-assembly protein LptD n=1 Tax=Vannielia litorea TaxID=1217970 RepID=UPI001C9897B7|nr:LPS assembly protein LptD [Vannielia litorea]MBY6047708.1 LPS assembly protein LptD [Vannielia litorea]MBY6075122.1 LPS assembly protein LptD [Vannielia litorea]